MPVYYSPLTESEVTASGNLADNSIARGDGGGKGIQDSAITIADAAANNVTVTAITNTALTFATLDNNRNINFTPHGIGYVQMGSSTPVTSSDNPGFYVSRTFSTAAVNAHGFSDVTQFRSTGQGYNAFDALHYVGTGGAGAYDHTVSFQSRWRFSGLTMTNGYSFWSSPVLTAGTVTTLAHLYIADTSGAGSLGVQYGIQILDLAKGGTGNVSITSEGANVRGLHNGPWVIGTASYGSYDGTSKLQVIGGQASVQRDSLGTTPSTGLIATNTTAAGAGAQQYSPAVRWRGNGWKTNATAASQATEFRMYCLPIQGAAAPTAALMFEYSVDGGAFSEVGRIRSSGDWVCTTGGLEVAGTTTTGAASSFVFSGRSRMKSASNGEISFRNNADNADANISTGSVTASLPVILPSYAVASLPSAATYTRGLIYVSDGTSNKRLAISDGTNWRFPDGNVVS